MGKCIESLEKKFTEASHNLSQQCHWDTDTDGFLEHSPSRGTLYYKRPTLQKIIRVFWVPHHTHGMNLCCWCLVFNPALSTGPSRCDIWLLEHSHQCHQAHSHVSNISTHFIAALLVKTYTAHQDSRLLQKLSFQGWRKASKAHWRWDSDNAVADVGEWETDFSGCQVCLGKACRNQGSDRISLCHLQMPWVKPQKLVCSANYGGCWGNHGKEKAVALPPFSTSPCTQITLFIFSNRTFKAYFFHPLFGVMACLEIPRVHLNLCCG